MTNPFVYDKPARASDLIDRTMELAFLKEAAEAGQNVVLSSPRRFGKTTLLKRVQADLEGDLPTAFVDLSGVLTLEDFLGRLEDGYRPLRRYSGRVYDWWRKRNIKVNALWPGAGGLSVEGSINPTVAAEVRRVLRFPELEQRRSGKPTLVIIDEFQDLIQLPGPVDGLIRSVIQHHTDCATYLFAGSHAGMLEAFFGTRERPLYGQAQPCRLGPLELHDLGAFIERRFRQSGRDPVACLPDLLDVGRGHPQRTILLAHHLWDEVPPGGIASVDAWSRALVRADDDLSLGFGREWDRLNQIERETIHAIASDMPAAEYVVERLKSEGVVLHGSGPPSLVDPLFERWLASASGARRRPDPTKIEQLMVLLATDVAKWPEDAVGADDPGALANRAAVARNLTARAQQEPLLREESELLERTIRSLTADVAETLKISFAEARERVGQALAHAD